MKTVSAYVRHNTHAACIFLGAVLFVSVIVCVGIGPVSIGFDQVWQVIFFRLFHIGDVSSIAENTQNIIWHLRVPRVLLGMMVGVNLSLAGVTMQAFTKNPLADPYILGISSGASFGAVLIMVTGLFTVLGEYRIQIGAFTGAVAAISIVYALSKSGRSVTPIKLVLVGVAVSAMFSAFTNFTVYSAPDDSKVREATFWMLGSAAGVKWEELLPPALVVLPGLASVLCLSSPLNAMMMGDTAATTLGVNVNSTRKLLIIVSALLTGVTVSVAGCIGFVGLVIPHIVRSLAGADHKKVIPLSALTGAIFLIWVDVAARMLDVPKEIPLGILTSIVGAPVFLWMIKAKKYSFGEKA